MFFLSVFPVIVVTGCLLSIQCQAVIVNLCIFSIDRKYAFTSLIKINTVIIEWTKQLVYNCKVD